VIATQQNCLDWADTLGLTYPVLSDFDQTVWNEYGSGYGRPLNLVMDQHMVIMWKEEGYVPGLADIIAELEQALPHPPLSGPEDPVDGEPAWFPSPPILNWSDSPSVGTQHDVTNYLVQVALDTGFTQLVLEQSTPDAASELLVSSELFQGGTGYYWRVRASDDAGVTWGTWSAAWTFTTHENFAVELGSLTAAWHGGSQVVVEWVTVSETGAYGFHVLRGRDGSGAHDRVTANLIPAVGTYAAGAAYSYTDQVPGPGRYSYLLEEVELTGVHHQYGPVHVVVGSSTPALTVAGNPVGDGIMVSFSLPHAASARLELWDLGGRMVRAKDLGTLQVGDHHVHWRFGVPLPPGHYTVRVTAEGHDASAKVVLTR
jgi:hypothetical protein